MQGELKIMSPRFGACYASESMVTGEAGHFLVRAGQRSWVSIR